MTANGTAKQALELALRLSRMGHSVTFAAFAFDLKNTYPEFSRFQVRRIIDFDQPFWKRIPVSPGKKEAWALYFALLMFPVFVLLAAKAGKQVVIANDWFTMWVGSCLGKDIPVLAVINDVPVRWESGWVNRTKLFIDRMAAGKVRKFLVLDFRNRELLRKWLAVPPETVSVLRSGINKALYRNPILKTDLRQMFEIPQGCPVLICANLPAPHRRYEDVFRAMVQLDSLKLKKPAHLVLLARSGFNSVYTDYLRELAARLHLSERIHYVDRFLSDQERLSYLKGADILVFPNSPQTWGLTVIEAMAAGIPVVVSDGSGVSEVLRHRGNALIYPAQNSKVLAENIAFLLREPREAREIAVAGKAYILKNFTWESYASKVVMIIREQVSNPPVKI